MDVSVIPLNDVDQRQQDLWRELSERAHERNPFFEPEFLQPAAAAQPRERPQLVVGREDGAWVACLPMIKARWKRGLPVRQTWRGMYGYLGAPLVVRERPELVGVMLRELLRLERSRSLNLEWVTPGGPIEEALVEATAGTHSLRERDRIQRALLTRREDGEYLGHMKPHHLREARRLRRRLSEDVGEVAITDRAGDVRAVDDFLETERKGWKGREGTAMISTPGDAGFFRAVCSAFAAAGRLHLLELKAGTEIVAMKCNIVAGDGAFAFKIAFDEAFARYSPGTQLELENIDHFHHSGLRWMDSCADQGNAMINRLWTGRRELHSLLLVQKRASASAVYRGLRTATAMRERNR